MRLLLFTLLLFHSLLIESQLANCQEQDSDDTTSSSSQTTIRSENSSSDISIAEIEMRMAESSYRITHSEERRLELVVAYEKMLGRVCMPKLLINKSYQPDPKNNECQDLINKVLSLYPHSPVAICARDGMLADSCKDAFVNQTFTTIKDDSRKPTIPDLDLQLDALRSDDDDKELKEDWKQALGAYQKESTQENLVFTAHKLISLIKHNCNLVRISYQREDKNGGDKQLGPLGMELPDNLGEKSEIASEDVAVFIRTVAVTNRCEQTIEDALKFDPYFPAAVCLKSTLTSPACLNAHKKWTSKVKATKSSNQSVKPKEEKAFETF